MLDRHRSRELPTLPPEAGLVEGRSPAGTAEHTRGFGHHRISIVGRSDVGTQLGQTMEHAMLPGDQLALQPTHHVTDGLMAPRTAEDLLGQSGGVPGTGSDQIRMPQHALDIDQATLVVFEDQGRTEGSPTQTRDANRQDSLGRGETSASEAIAIPASVRDPLIPVSPKLVLLQMLQGLLDPADDELADLLVDPVPEKVLACGRFRW